LTSLAAHHGREAVDNPVLAELEKWKTGPKVCHEQSSPLQLLALERSTAAPLLRAFDQPNGRCSVTYFVRIHGARRADRVWPQGLRPTAQRARNESLRQARNFTEASGLCASCCCGTDAKFDTIALQMGQPVWRFRSPHHNLPGVRDADFW